MKNLRNLLRRVRPLMSRNAQESSKGSDGRSRLVRQTKRRLLSETLEQRQLLAGDFGAGVESSANDPAAATFEQRSVAHNYWNKYDVDNNGQVTALDALRIINHLNSTAEGEPVALGASTTGFVDVNEDSSVTPLDALMVINRLNAEGEDTLPEDQDDFVVQYRIQPRDLDDNLLTQVGTYAGVNDTGGTLPGESDIYEIEQGEIFKIEVGAQDTRGRFDRDGLFQSVVDVLIEQSGAIEPVIGEVQGADVPDTLFTSAAPTGTLTFYYENDTNRTFETSIEAFVGNSDSDTARVVANAIAAINDDVTVDEFGNTDDISVTAGVRPESGFYQFRVAYTALDLAGEQIPRLITELRFDGVLQQDAVVIIEDDVVVNGQFNPDALKGNLEVFTRNFSGAMPAVGSAELNGDFEGAGTTPGEQFYGTLRSGRFIVNPGGSDVFDEIGVSGGISTAADEIGPLDPTVFYDTFSIIVRAVTPSDGVVIRAEAAPERDAVGDLPVFEGVLLYGSDAGDEKVAVEDLRFDEDAQFQLRITSNGTDTITAPNAVLTVNEDTTGVQNTNASSTSGGTIEYAIVGTSAQGSATIDANGQITYVPNANANGTDTVTYSATIPGTTPLLTATGTLNVTITPVNDEPIANDDNGGTATVGQSPILIPVLANDDAGGGNEPIGELTLSVTNTGADAPTLGTVAVVTDNNGTFVQYTPSAGAASGTDTFTYTISDADFSDTAVVTVNVVNNSTGVSADDFTATAIDEDSDEAVVVDLVAQGLLTAVTGSTSFLLDSAVSDQGTVTSSGLVISFEPNDNFNGTATITYTVSNDVVNGADSGTITIPVNSINDDPIAFNLDFDVNERSVDFPLNILQLGVGQAPTDVEDADSSLTVQLPDGVTSVTLGNNEGTVTVDSNNVFLVTLTSAAPQDDLAFNYQVVDSNGGIGNATINLDVLDVQDPPTADNTTVTGVEDGANISVDLDTLGNAENNPTITYSIVSFDADDLTAAPTIDANNNLIIDPALNFNGTTTVTYRATVGNQFAEGVVTVNVTPVNDDPTVPSPIARTVLEDSQIDIDILSLASDVDDGDILSAAVATNPSNGSVVPQGNGVFRYIPNANFNGSDSFTVTVSDNSTGSVTTTVNLTVTDTVADPVANDGTLNATEDGGVVTLDLNTLVDLDPGDTATITLSTGATNGNASIANGILSYTPNANFNGTDSIVYTATNTANVSDTGTITISVGSINDNPIANDDSAVTSRGNSVVINVLNNDNPDPANEGDSVTVSVEAGDGPSNGSVSITGNVITYTPNADFADAVDTFTYTLTDSSGGTDTAVVTVTVNDFATRSVGGQLFQDSADNIVDVIENGATPAGNGVKDAHEIGLGGVAVRLQSAAGSNASGDAVDVIAITDRDGNFAFDEVPVGTEYTLTYALPSDVVLMEGSSRSLTFAVNEDTSGAAIAANLGLAGIGSLARGGYNVISTSPGTDGLPEGIEEDEQSSFLFTADAALGMVQAGFVVGEGFDGIEYLELSLSSDGTQALLTTIDVVSGDAAPTVQTAVVDSSQLHLQVTDDGSVRARLFGAADDFNFVDDIGDLANDFPAYQAAIDQILSGL